MCGIAGWIGPLDNGQQIADRMASALAHRGPNSRGKRSWPEAALVHTRLSILDLSPTGQQPMSNEDGTVWVVCNGEIYNHRELRQSLERKGHHFRGRSDSEVLPHLYEEEGLSFVNKLRGMFALAVYDSRTKTLVLVRDRFGIKPLFYAPSGERMVFASELRAILNVPDVDTEPDRQAIYDYAALFYIPAPETFYRGIRALEPGEMLVGKLDHGGLRWNLRKYHQWSTAPDPSLTLEEATDRTETLLATAVGRQLQSDVPMGAFLSGGIDSSLISAVAQDSLPRGELRTFNVAFSKRTYDESSAASNVARAIGSDHTTLKMEDNTATWQTVTELLLHCGQPFADTSVFATNAVCRLAKQHATSVLSGDGGDEGFGGYDENRRISRLAKFQALPTPLWRLASVLTNVIARSGCIPNHWPNRFRLLAGASDTTILRNTWCWLSEDAHRRFCRDTNLEPVSRLFEPRWKHHLPPNASRTERINAHLSEITTRLVLANDFLFKVDTASMKESLEVRVPFLDEDLFEFCLTLPHHLKLQGRSSKVVLRNLVSRKISNEIAQKPKHGFGMPLDSWVTRDFRTMLGDCLLDPSNSLAEYFQPDAYRPLVEAVCKNRWPPGVGREQTFVLAIMLLALQLTLDSAKSPGVSDDGGRLALAL